MEIYAVIKSRFMYSISDYLINIGLIIRSQEKNKIDIYRLLSW